MEESKSVLENGIDKCLDICVGGRRREDGVKIADGAHGLVISEDDGRTATETGVCMPSPCALGCSFDRNLLRDVGRAVGSVASRGGFDALLSPDAGVVRSPLSGSLADRFGEDPYLCGTLAGEWVKGVQSVGVAAVLTGFAGSSQSTGKFTCDEMIDRRALNEMYLRPFEMAVRSSHPRGIQCGVNRINGVAVCENQVLLTDILRRQWGFDGAVTADMRLADPAEAMASGVDLSRPAGGGRIRRKIKKAVKNGEIPEHYPALSAGRVRAMTAFSPEETDLPMDEDEWGEMAVKAAEACAVLLKNHRRTLPLPLGCSIALIGRQAKYMRIQRRGVSALPCPHSRNLLNVFDDNQIRYRYCEGFGENSLPDSGLLSEAVQCASESEFAVVFVGFDDVYDNAAADRFTNQLPKAQTKLISAVAKVNPNTVVVAGGSALPKMNWVGKVKAVLYLPLGGEGTAEALFRLLFGFTDPCGRLPVSYSLSETDMPCGDTFGVDPLLSPHRESLLVGYRYYDKSGIYPAFPFGYGLSYTRFEYSRMRAKACGDGFEVTVDVKNTGMRDGSEIVQFYIEHPKGEKGRPVRELRQFCKVFLIKGEKRTVSVELPRSSFVTCSQYDGNTRVTEGRYLVCAAASSSDVRAHVWVSVDGEPPEDSRLPQWYVKPSGRPAEADFTAIFGEPTSRRRLPTEPAYSEDDTLDSLSSIGVFKAAVKLIRWIGEKVIRPASRREPEYAERMDRVLHMPVKRLCGMCGGFYPMKLTRLVIAIANRRGRKYR